MVHQLAVMLVLQLWVGVAAAGGSATAGVDTLTCVAPVAATPQALKHEAELRLSRLTCSIETSDAANVSAGATGVATLDVSIDRDRLLPGAHYADVKAFQYLRARPGPRRGVRVATISDDDPSSVHHNDPRLLASTLSQLDALGASGVDIVTLKEAQFGGASSTLEASPCMRHVAPIAARHGFYVVCPFIQARLGSILGCC
jgi:hypothetical protein